MELSKENYRAYIFIEFSRGLSARQIVRQLNDASIPNSPSERTILRWHNAFRAGRRSLDDDPRDGRPLSMRTNENIQNIGELIQQNPKLSLRQLSEETGLSKDTVRTILVEDLSKRKVCSVWVPHTLSAQNKSERVACANSIIKLIDDNSIDDLMKFWVTEDETWQHFSPLPVKQENMAWLRKDEKRCRVVQPKLTNKKAMIILAFTGDQKFSVETRKPGDTVTSEDYVQFIKTTGDKWRRLHSSPTKLSSVWWQHDNARPHIASNTNRFFVKRNISLIKQSPYSPDLNQCDAWLFSELKKEMRSKEFKDCKEVEIHALHFLRSLPRNRFVKEISNMYKHCKAVVDNLGDYVTK